MGGQLHRQEDGGGAVGSTDDADGSRFRAGKADANGQEKRHKDAQLSRSAHQHALGIGKQRAEVRHSAHAQENQAGIQAGFDADVEKVQQAALRQHMAVAVVERTALIHKIVPQLLVVQASQGKIAQQTAKGNAHQQ